MTRTLILASALLCTCVVAHAQAVITTSRATVDLGGGTWVELGRGKVVVASIDRWGDLVAEVVTSASIEGRRVRAIVTVNSTPSSPGGRVDWAHECLVSTDAVWSMPLRGGHPEDVECTRATAPADAAAMLKHRPEVREAIVERSLEMPDEVVSMSASIFTRHGRMMSIDVWADKGFAGLDGGKVDPLPARVAAAHAGYAEELGRSVRESIFSMRGRTALPPMRFSTDMLPVAPLRVP